MARRKGIRKSQDNNVPGAPGATPFRPTNGAGPGQRDPRSAGQDNAGFFFGGGGGQHNPGTGQARPQDMGGGRGPRTKRGEPGMVYAGGTPGFYDKGGPGAPGKVYQGGELPQVGYPGGAQIQPFPGGNNGGGDNLPGFGGQFPIPGARPAPINGGENTIGIPENYGGRPFTGGRPQSPGGRPGPGIPHGQVGGGENTIGIPENYGGRPFTGGRPAPGKGRGGRPQRPPGRGMPSGGPGLTRPQFPGMNIPQAPGMDINQTFNGDNNTYTR